MRLIDAWKLRERFAAEPMPNRTYSRADDIVDEMPVAYDVDRVIEQIRKYADNVAELGGNFLPQVVIEIIKSGGID